MAMSKRAQEMFSKGAGYGNMAAGISKGMKSKKKDTKSPKLEEAMKPVKAKKIDLTLNGK